MQPAAGLTEQLQRTRFDELAVLVMVAESGSLSAAAQRLGVPKSTVGRAIARIEEDLGVVLVRRMARGQALTEPGRVLAALAAPHVAALRDVTAALGRESSDVYGSLRITAPADVGTLLIAPLLPSFFSRYPRVRIQIEHTLRVVDLAREGVDLAVRLTLGRLPSSTLIAKKLTRMNLALYAGTAYAAGRDLPKNTSDLHKHDHVVFYPGGNSLALEGPKGIVKVPVQGRVASNDFFFLREAIAAGVGIGPLPWFLAKPELAAGRITRVLPDYRAAGGTAYLVYPPTKPFPAKLSKFCAHLLEHVPRLAMPG
jgi:DNA-binding transcriptional LysR family regulator